MNCKIFFYLFFIHILFLNTNARAQSVYSEKADSLRKVLNEKTGTDKISVQLDLSLQLSKRDKEEAKQLAESALAEAKQAGNKSLEMRAYFVLGKNNLDYFDVQVAHAYLDSALNIANLINDNWFKSEILLRMGSNYHTHGDNLKALQAFNDAVKVGLQAKNYKTVGAAYSLMGAVFRVHGLYDKAIEYIIKSRLNYEKVGFKEGDAWTAYILGRIYTDLQSHEKALEYYNESLRTYKNLSDKDGDKGGLALCYEQIGLLNLESGKLEEARKNIGYTLDIHTENGSKYGISNAFKNLGKIEYTSGNYGQAEEYLKFALEEKKKMGEQLNYASIYEYIGLCLVRTNQVEKGLEQINKGLKIAIANNQKRIQFDIYSDLTRVYLNLGNLEKALEYQNQQITMQDVMLSGAANTKMEQLQAIVELDAKNSQIAELEQQNEINSLKLKQHRISYYLMIAGIFVAIIIATIIYLFYRRIREKNNQLEEANAAKDKFFAIIAHDLRGPTHTQTTFLEHLDEDFGSFSSEELKELLHTLYKSSENISTLLDNLLLWAQSQVNKIEIKSARLQLSEVVLNALDSIKHSSSVKQININNETNDQLYVMADQNMLQTILRNILGNAVKFTPRGGSVHIKTSAITPKEITLIITDTGVGMEKAILSKIFDISNSNHSQGTENEKSNGLGLILVKDFVEKNKGTIRIESQKNVGTSVIITLPSA